MKKILICSGLLSLVVFFYSCVPHIGLSTVHPDVDKEITFNVTKGTTRGTVTEMKLEIEGSEVASQSGTSLTYTGGPYPPYSNAKLNFKAIALKSTGGTATNSGWVYVANPKGVYSYTAPSGSNDGYPNATSEQTGANLYRLDKAIVRSAAQDALLEYANDQGVSVLEISNIADELVAAVALYVDNHMSWRRDSLNRIVFSDNGWGSYSPGWDFPQPADLSLTISGNLDNATPNDDYQGDCEDHAILRAALLRALGFAPWAIWDAIDYQPDADRKITHEYNIVLYEGAYRLMDYGRITRWLNTHTWDSHMSHYGWNEDHGPRSANNTNHNFLKDNTHNFPGGKTCQDNWSYLIYYRDTCN